jgi:hypothetical protein
MKVSTSSTPFERILLSLDVLSEEPSKAREFVQRYKDVEKYRIKSLIQRYKSMEQSIKQRETRLERRDEKSEPRKKMVCESHTILCSNNIELEKRVFRKDGEELPNVMRGGRGIDYQNRHNGGFQYRKNVSKVLLDKELEELCK